MLPRDCLSLRGSVGVTLIIAVNKQANNEKNRISTEPKSGRSLQRVNLTFSRFKRVPALHTAMKHLKREIYFTYTVEGLFA
jgi:hypothetical protein